jgi:hypothetical protein
MKKIDDLLDITLCKNFINNFPSKKIIFCDIVKNFPSSWTRSKSIGRIKVIVDILTNNEVDDYPSLIDEYNNSTSIVHKLDIRYGKGAGDEYVGKLKTRPKPKVFSILTTQYWISKGFSLEEASSIISEKQRENALKRSSSTYRGHKKKIKHSLEYWTSRGYSNDEAKILREPYLDACKNDLDHLVSRYGEELGVKKYFSRVQKYKSSMIENFHTKRTGGYVSKESIKFFVPLYKYCRKLGIDREDIFWGINGSREFFIKDCTKDYNTGKFYDFTIKSLKIIIEYHGTYWHPRDRQDWKNPTDYETAVSADLYKNNLAETFGMEYNIVWSSDDLQAQLEKLKKYIKEKYDRRSV